MSRATPRKSRHRRQPSSNGPRHIQASDYESDAAHYMETREAPPNPPNLHRTNTDLNLSVLRRHLPDIQSILSQAANAVVYTFSPVDQEWHKQGVEGTMFVCQQEPLVLTDGQVLPRACVFILNRRSLDNLSVDLMKVSHCEVAGELIILKLEDDHAIQGEEEEGADVKVLGVWVHADKDDTRQVNAAIIDAAWNQTRMGLDALAQKIAAAQGNAADAGAATEVPDSQQSAQDAQAAGRRLSITDLFGQRNGNG